MTFSIARSPLSDVPAAVRLAIAELEQQLSELAGTLETPEAREAMTDLRASWAAFVDLLDAPPVDRRRCRVCEHLEEAAATRCSYCWTKFAASA
jgi:hypothetical protein